MEILFQFLRYWGLQHNWNMRNAFMFDNRHGVKAYIKKLKGILMWNFRSMWGSFPQMHIQVFLIALQNVPLPT